jgi:hypothetical protein
MAGGNLSANNLCIDGTFSDEIDYSNDYPFWAQVSAGNITIAGSLDLSFSEEFLSGLSDPSSAVGFYDYILSSSNGVVSGEFSNAPEGAILDVDGQALQVQYDPGDVEVIDVGAYVPEPSAISLLLLVGGCLARRRRRRNAGRIR